jgi:D-threo-aldose 1-dehydrogenase
MNPREQIRVGTTALHIGRLGFGGAALAAQWVHPNGEFIAAAQAVATVQQAFKLGIRTFDVAPVYGGYAAETRVGLALQGIPRDQFVLSSKVGRLLGDDHTVTVDFSRDGILQSLDGTLTRLRTDRLDIIHLHDPDSHYREALDVAFPVLAELRAQGVVQAIGAGMNQWQMLLDFARNADFDCFMLAGRYTLLEQGALPLVEYCATQTITLLFGGVFNTGILATGAIDGARYNYAPASAEILTRVREIETLCRCFDVPLTAAAVQFPIRFAAANAIILGMMSPQEVDDNLRAFETPIAPEFWAAFDTHVLQYSSHSTSAEIDAE